MLKIKQLLPLLFFVSFQLISPIDAEAYTTTYNGITYSSNQPYNLDIYYFVASDVDLDPAYTRRISGMMLWLQDYYKTWMGNKGYGSKTFGLWTQQAHPDSVRIILVDGMHDLDFYRSTNPGGNDSLINEIGAFRTANPAYTTSEHFLVLTATPGVNELSGLPYYGIGRSCYATDYPQLDLQNIGQGPGDFVTYFGGLAHELGHCLNLPHSHQTATEDASASFGESLMAAGNYTLTASPTFINRAGCAILNNCQLFSQNINTGFYNGHVAHITALHSTVTGGNLIVSGRFQSNRPVTDINFYQDPGASPTAGYVRVAFSVPPLGALQDSFWVSMPASEVLQNLSTYPPTGAYNFEIELVLNNGETSQDIYPFQYSSSVPVPPADFDFNNCDQTPGGWQLTDIGAVPTFPGQACWNDANSSLRLTSWGTVLGDNSDQITYLYVPINGDDTITARVTATPSEWNNLIGLMIRSDLADDANFVSISSLDTRGVFNLWRSTTGGGTNYDIVTTYPLPMWLRLARTGNTIYGWYSEDGTNWTLYNTKTQSFSSTAYFGLVCAGGGASGVLDNIRIASFPSGIQEQHEANDQWTLYPNPATDELKVDFVATTSGKHVFTVKDLDGRTVLSQSCNSMVGKNTVRLNTQSLASGIYFVESLSADGRVGVRKVVIQKHE